MNGAQPMSEANALAVVNASPKAPTFGGYGSTHVIEIRWIIENYMV